MSSEDKLLSIIKHYGVLPQLKYFQSEVFELNEAIIRYDTLNDDDLEIDYYIGKQNITEEVADVLVMLMQFIYRYNLEPSEIEKVFNYKINRQLNRIEGENYKE